MDKIAGVKELILAWGGYEAFGKFLFPGTKQPKARAYDIARRKCVPAHHWPKLVKAAPARGIALTDEQLKRWRQRAPKQPHHSGTQKHEAIEGAHARSS